MSCDIVNTKKKLSPSHNVNMDLISTQSLSSINQDNDNKIYQEMKELFGKKRKSESRIDDLFEHRPRFNSTNCEITFDSQRLFDNPDFFPSNSKKSGTKEKSKKEKINESNPFSINFDIDNDSSAYNQTNFFDDNLTNNIHTDMFFNTLDYDKFNL